MTTISSFTEMLPVESTLILVNPATNEAFISAEDGMPISVTMVGATSANFFKETYEAAKRRAEAGEAAKTSEYQLEERAHFIAACLTGWSHDNVFGGKFSRKKAFDLFKCAEASIYGDQVEAHLTKIQHFFKQ